MTSSANAAGKSRSVANARIAGVVSCVPPREIVNEEFERQFGADGVRDVVKMIGVQRRYWTDDGVTTSDLCCRAAQVLLQRLGWARDSLSAVIFVSQTPDYRLPATACSLHGRLGLAATCAAFDVNLGCSGYVYGLWLAMTLAAAEPGSRVLLLVGDTISKTIDPQDRSTVMLFGDAGTASGIEATETDRSAKFLLGTDGAGATNLIIPTGAFRAGADADPRLAGRNAGCLFMDGAEIFNFTLSHVPPLVDGLLAFSGDSRESIDAFLFHQANAFMLRHLVKKMRLDASKVPVNIDRFGNTSSASLPLLLTTDLAAPLMAGNQRVALLGFGVGYSWGGAVMDIGPLSCAETVVL